MTQNRMPIADSGTTARDIVLVAALAALLHVAIAFLLADPAAAFLLGDRAEDRLRKMAEFAAAGDLPGQLAVLFRIGSPGDYMPFWPAYAAGGYGLVVVMNTALHLVGLVYLYRLATDFFPRRVALLACAIYALLPSSLYHPHTLSSEAIVNPLLIAACFHAARMLSAIRPRWQDAIWFCAFCAVAIWVRNINALLPAFAASLLFFRFGLRLRTIAVAAVLLAGSHVLTLSWTVTQHTVGAGYEHVLSLHGLGSNLYWRAARFTPISGVEIDPDIQARKSMTIGEFAAEVARQPGAYARTLYTDGVNFIANSGMTMVFGRYFGLFHVDGGETAEMLTWRDIRDRQGFWASVVAMAKQSPGSFWPNVIGFAMHAAMLVAAGVAALAFLAHGVAPLVTRMLLVFWPVYYFVFSFIAASSRWDLRSPTEFLIVLFLSAGLLRCARGRSPPT